MNFTEKTRPYFKKSLFSVKLSHNQIMFAFTKNENIIYQLKTDLQKSMIMLLNGENSIKDIYVQLRKKNISCSIDDIFEEVSKLYNLYLLESSAADNDKEYRFSRQELFWGLHRKNGLEFAGRTEKILKNTYITILGLGGFGSHLVYNLAYSGVGKIKCVDFDTVNISNLNRQILYREEDVGRLKTEAGRRNIREVNSETAYEFINKKITSKDDIVNLIDKSDLVILAADSPRDQIFKWTNIASYETGVPVLFTLGFSSRFIRIGPLFIPKQTTCFQCSMPDMKFDFHDPFVEFINKRHKHGSIIPHVSIAAGIMVLETIKHLTGYSECRLYNNRINFDVIDYSITIDHFVPKNSCEFCKKS